MLTPQLIHHWKRKLHADESSLKNAQEGRGFATEFLMTLGTEERLLHWVHIYKLIGKKENNIQCNSLAYFTALAKRVDIDSSKCLSATPKGKEEFESLPTMLLAAVESPGTGAYLQPNERGS